MKNLSTRWFLIVAAVGLSIWSVADPSKFKLGPDLSGGTILIYQVNKGEGGRTIQMGDLIGALKKRLDPAGLYNYVIRELGNDRVEIIMPQAEPAEVDRVKRLVSTVGQLEFKIVAARKRHADLMDRAEAAWPNRLVGKEGVFVPYGQWMPVQRNQSTKEIVERADKAWPNRVVEPGLKYVPASELTSVPVDDKTQVVKTEGNRPFVLVSWQDDEMQFDPRENMVREDDKGDKYVLMVVDEQDVSGRYLKRVGRTMNDGDPAVSFEFDDAGGARFGKLTSEYVPEEKGQYHYRLGVILDNRLRSAPRLNQRIDKHGVITGQFSKEEIDNLVRILDAGQLPFALEKEPSSQFQIAATLGKDTIQKGEWSIGVSLGVVILFIAFYYRTAGLVANFALFLNLLFTVALMVMFKATWTLPGLAGLVLTVGMSIDANVLIFERMREEFEHGASFGAALRNGYDKAWSTIFDSNTTTILTAVILFAIGTDQVKGFAVTIILGIITSLFSAIFFTRTVFETLYARRWINKLSMVKFMERPNFDFLKATRACFAFSAIVLLAGIVAVAVRGKNNLDIDFTGGTMVGLRFNKALETGVVRELASQALPDVAVEDVRLESEEPGRRFVIRTTERDSIEAKDQETVRQKVARVFKDYLDLPKLGIGEVKAIEAASDPKAKTAPLQAFVGGQQADITFDNARSADNVRGHFHDVLKASNPTVANVDDLYALVPVGNGEQAADGAADQLGYKSFTIGMKNDLASVLASLQKDVESSPQFDQFNQFGPQVAGDTQERAIFAVVLSWLSIIIYVGFRFGSWTFGLSGVIALVHDVLAAVGLIALVSMVASLPGAAALPISDMKIDLNAIAAILTLIGYSINDTIVIFDRIREIRGKSPTLTKELINRALNETLSRTIITSLSTFLTVVVLYLGGGIALRGFSFILVVGLISGTYSTIYIACPFLLILSDYDQKRKAKSPGGRSSSASAAAL